MQIIHALNLERLFLRLRQSRQEHRRENGDDRDHHEKFNQRKSALGSRLNRVGFRNRNVICAATIVWGTGFHAVGVT